MLKYRSSHQRCSIVKGVLRILQNSQENTCARVSFLLILFFNFIKKETLALVFSVNFAKFLRTPFLQNTSWRILLEIWVNIPKSAWLVFVLHVPIVIPSLLEPLVTYFNHNCQKRNDRKECFNDFGFFYCSWKYLIFEFSFVLD